LPIFSTSTDPLCHLISFPTRRSSDLRIELAQTDYLNRGPRRISPFFVPGSLINLVSGQLSINLGLKGPSYAVVSACTTGLHSIGDRKSTRLNSSHVSISYAVVCLK